VQQNTASCAAHVLLIMQLLVMHPHALAWHAVTVEA